MKKKPRISMLWSTPRLRISIAVLIIGLLLSIAAAVPTNNYAALVCIGSLGPILLLVLQKLEAATKTSLKSLSVVNADVVASQEATNNLNQRLKILGQDLQAIGGKIESSSKDAVPENIELSGRISVNGEEFLEILDLVMRMAEASANTSPSNLSAAQEASLQVLLDHIEPEHIQTVDLTTSTNYSAAPTNMLTLKQMMSGYADIPPGTCVILTMRDFQQLRDEVIDWSRFEDTAFIVAADQKQVWVTPPSGFIEVYPAKITYGLRIFYPASRVMDVSNAEAK